MGEPRSIVAAEAPPLGAGTSIVPLSAGVDVESLGAGAVITHLSAATEVERLAAVVRVILTLPSVGVALPLSQVLGQAAASCQLVVEYDLSGAVTGIAVVTGTIGSYSGIAGFIGGTSIVTGALAIDIELEGDASGIGTVSAELEPDRSLVLDPIFGSASVVGAAERNVSLEGSAAGAATVIGGLVGGSVELVPQAVGGVITIIHGEVITDIEGNPLIAINQDISIVTCTVDFETEKALAGTVAGSSSTACQIALEVGVEGQADGSATVAGDLEKSGGLEGSVTGTATTAGAVDRTVAPVPDAVTAVATVTAAVLVDVDLAGSVAGTSSATQALSVEHPLAGTATGSATVSGEISGDLELAGSADGVASLLTASLAVEHPLAGTATGDTTTTCYVGRTQPVAGDSVTGDATVTGEVEVEVDLIPVVAGDSTVTGATSVAHPLAGSVTGDSTAAGTIQGDLEIIGFVDGEATVATLALPVAHPLAGTVSGTATVAEASVGRTVPLAGDSVSGTATVSGSVDADIDLAGTVSGTSSDSAEIDMSRALVLDAIDGDATTVGEVDVDADMVLDAITGTATTAGAIEIERGLELDAVTGDATVVGAIARTVALEPSTGGEEDPFDIVGATYYAVAPSGYSYSSEETTNYSTRKYTTISDVALNTSPTGPQIVNIIGDWTGVTDTGRKTWSGVSTTAANYVEFRTIGDARHNGIPRADTGSNAKGYVLKPTGSGHAVTVGNAFFIFRGLEVSNASTAASDEAFRVQEHDVTIDQCIVKANGTVSDQDGIHITHAGWDRLTVTNCLVLDWPRAGITIQHYSSTAVDSSDHYFANNTVVDCGSHDGNTDYAGGIVFHENAALGYISATLYNNLVVRCSQGTIAKDITTSGNYGDVNVTLTGSNNITVDDSYNDDGLTGGLQKTVAALDFVDDANNDFHIEATSDAVGAGSDRSADSEHSGLDIDGGTRDGWDVGFDEQGVVATYGTGLTGSATVSGAVDPKRGLEADAISGTATVAGAIDISRSLALDAVDGAATVSAAVSVGVVLAGTVAGDSTVAGAAERTATLAGSASGSATTAGGLDMERSLALDEAAGDSTVVGAMSVSRDLEADAITGVATVSAAVTTEDVELEPAAYDGWLMEIDDDLLTLISGNPLVAIGEEISRADCDLTVT